MLDLAGLFFRQSRAVFCHSGHIKRTPAAKRSDYHSFMGVALVQPFNRLTSLASVPTLASLVNHFWCVATRNFHLKEVSLLYAQYNIFIYSCKGSPYFSKYLFQVLSFTFKNVITEFLKSLLSVCVITRNTN